jgi:5-methylcytosine-specific restriction endonuclease McrA
MEYYQKAVYKDPRWKYIRQAVIERDRDICYFCGRLILRKRTIHHLIEIDEHNYSDPEIAFNLDNLVECHNTCHDQYHERFGKATMVNSDLDIDYSKRERRKK